MPDPIGEETIVARISRITLALTALLGVAVLSAQSPASAAAQDNPTAFNTREQFLDAHPTPIMDKVCIDRRIELAAGNYDWNQVLGDAKRSNVYLGAGWYTWEDCLIPDDGFYRQETSLNPDNSDWQTIRLKDDERLTQSAIFTWGSYLDPL
ncbi:hypothetical protein [Streptomyces sp. Inha503]|uniref:hypothetical protein n=1 Tax=Streptomyces sp. Inha503 TaxID=3383314 RepID=UPI00399FB62D